MASARKLGQFGHTFRRNYETVVQTVEQRSHGSESSAKLWRNLTFFVAFPTILVGMVNTYLRHKEGHHKRPDPIPYPHLKIMNKPFPWGDGKHSLFHNPKANYIPGIGYEE